MQMFGAVMKSYFAEQIGKKPEDIFSVAIMPCLAKKGEANMELFYKEYAGHDTDCVITTRELIRMIKVPALSQTGLLISNRTGFSTMLPVPA